MLKAYRNLNTWIWVGLAILVAFISLFFQKTLLHFINTLAMVGFIYFAIGIFRLSWIKGDYAFLSYRKLKHHDFKTYRENIIERRKDIPNTIFYASFVVLVLCVVLHLFY
ncbi:hypothetical protein [Bulleidia sp. zg-1006]|uniref:hypothetical protein n=1 Tax=Bulleidia sp. zg-1006 TaxID=2806552 RepID=UPI001939FAD0|nr:hypothetical protein [Bulleidia sp. zg-1006]QRG86325.1 hypothetical protein JOS54_05540 [Bulleidia sp. zg-1006]